ncbi:transporter [Bacteroidia bacterium]|nr:transporter [Bacteroidia bacterium]
MIIKFTVGNFLSFNERRTLDFEAQGISELKQNVIPSHKLLRSIVVYGANSSGKSNLIKALHRMRDLVLNSVKLNDSDELEFTPFLLSAENKNTPTFFEVIFSTDNKKIRYGFEYSQTKIVNEWLFTGKSSKTEKALFIRTEEGIGVSDQFEEGQGKEEATNENRLFISLVAQLGGVISKQIMECFRNYSVLSGVTHKDYINMLFVGSKESLSLFQTLKLGFSGVEIIEKEMLGKTTVAIKTIHNKYDKNGKITDTVLLDSVENESEGTKKIMDLSGPIFDTLLLGNVLIIDELDSKLHPLITIQIVNLFNNPQTNPNNAQLLFATHDTNLLDADLFRRDQVWFTEKDDREQTDLYSLYDFNFPDGSKVRNDANLEKNYIRGRYGAIPFITD